MAGKKKPTESLVVENLPEEKEIVRNRGSLAKALYSAHFVDELNDLIVLRAKRSNYLRIEDKWLVAILDIHNLIGAYDADGGFNGNFADLYFRISSMIISWTPEKDGDWFRDNYELIPDMVLHSIKEMVKYLPINEKDEVKLYDPNVIIQIISINSILKEAFGGRVQKSYFISDESSERFRSCYNLYRGYFDMVFGKPLVLYSHKKNNLKLESLHSLISANYVNPLFKRIVDTDRGMMTVMLGEVLGMCTLKYSSLAINAKKPFISNYLRVSLNKYMGLSKNEYYRPGGNISSIQESLSDELVTINEPEDVISSLFRTLLENDLTLSTDLSSISALDEMIKLEVMDLNQFTKFFNTVMAAFSKEVMLFVRPQMEDFFKELAGTIDAGDYIKTGSVEDFFYQTINE